MTTTTVNEREIESFYIPLEMLKEFFGAWELSRNLNFDPIIEPAVCDLLQLFLRYNFASFALTFLCVYL